MSRRTFGAGAAAAALSARGVLAADSKIEESRPMVQIRRSFADVRSGQLHVRTATPQAEATRTPLICFHQSPNSGRNFLKFLPVMASDRIVYAPDTPGFGDSDVPKTQPKIEDYAAAMGDWIDTLGHDAIDLVGYHTGAQIAITLALARPQRVRRLVLVGIPVFEQADRDRFDAQPWPVPIKDDGSNVIEEWKRSMQWRGPGQTIEMVINGFVDKMGAGQTGWWGARAAIHDNTAEKLPQLTQPILAIRAKDDLWEIMPRAKPLIPRAEWVDLPDYGFGLFSVAAEMMAERVRRFTA
jgi:pimeloyl-ACP methyl ester carboxylesterase